VKIKRIVLRDLAKGGSSMVFTYNVEVKVTKELMVRIAIARFLVRLAAKVLKVRYVEEEKPPLSAVQPG